MLYHYGITSILCDTVEACRKYWRRIVSFLRKYSRSANFFLIHGFLFCCDILFFRLEHYQSDHFLNRILANDYAYKGYICL